MITQTLTTDLDASIALKLYKHQITLINSHTDHEVSFVVATLSDRFVDVLNAIRAERAALGLKGCYELFECLPLA